LACRLSFVRTIPRHPTSPLFPYTSLFRSIKSAIIYISSGSQLCSDTYTHNLFLAPFAHPASKCALLPQGKSNRQSVHHSSALKSDRKSTRLNSSHVKISYAVLCLKKKQTS